MNMANKDDNKQRRLVEFKDGCRYGKFGKTKAYELIAEERIRAYKMGGKTLIDLDSIDEYHASLPRRLRQIGRLAKRSSVGVRRCRTVHDRRTGAEEKEQGRKGQPR